MRTVVTQMPTNTMTVQQLKDALIQTQPIIVAFVGTSGGSDVSLMRWDFGPEGRAQGILDPERFFYFTDYANRRHTATKGLDNFLKRIEPDLNRLFVFDTYAEFSEWLKSRNYQVRV